MKVKPRLAEALLPEGGPGSGIKGHTPGAAVPTQKPDAPTHSSEKADNSQAHADASQYHQDQAEKHRAAGNHEKAGAHDAAAEAHYWAAQEHRSYDNDPEGEDPEGSATPESTHDASQKAQALSKAAHR